MKRFILFGCILLSIGLIFSACKSSQVREAEKMVNEWMGKAIVFPHDVPCYSIDRIELDDCPTSERNGYKILLYTDSLGCMSCKLGLLEWQELIEEADSLFPGELDFLFYFQPSNAREMAYLLQREAFHHPVFIDSENKINALNHFPDNAAYQCFLLDANNQVVIVGNPAKSSRIWELYKRLIKQNQVSLRNKMSIINTI